MNSFFDVQQALQQKPAKILSPGQVPQAAVALVLFSNGQLLMMRRAKREGDPWSGHMAFPGGRREPQDVNLQATAERETLEEVRLDLQRDGQLLGRLDDMLHPKMYIAAFVYGVSSAVQPQGNEEVDTLYRFPLQQLRDPQKRGQIYRVFQQQRHRFPAIHIDDAEIWGISLGFIDDLLARIPVFSS